MKKGYVYIMSSKSKTLYVGVTNNIVRRVYEHKNPIKETFTAKYSIFFLVYFDQHSDIINAIAREKQLKGWKRIRKIRLIESMNPEWKDLSDSF